MAYPQNDVILSFMLTYLQRHKDFCKNYNSSKCTVSISEIGVVLLFEEFSKSCTDLHGIFLFTSSPTRTHDKVARKEIIFFE